MELQDALRKLRSFVNAPTLSDLERLATDIEECVRRDYIKKFKLNKKGVAV